MSRNLRKIGFVVEDMTLGGPGQQLLDRFLMGYPREGQFHRPAGCQVVVWRPKGADSPELKRREQDFGLVCAPSPEAAVKQADGLIVVPARLEEPFGERLLKPILTLAEARSALFVYGPLGLTLREAKQALALATERGISLLAATTTAVTFRLPDVDVPAGSRLSEALIIVQGSFPQAELEALNGLFPLLERRHGGETGVRRVRYFEGAELWSAGERGDWSWSLLAAAISRSDSPQGDAVRDGRTQDLVGLGLVPKLATAPRGWFLEHADGLRSTVLILDGVVADFNFALQTRRGQTISAQLYRPPLPQQQHFSRLAAVVEEFFRAGKTRVPIERGLLMANLLEAFGTMRDQDLRELNLR